jgi:alkylhydroperoxidase/carboxymuconolactone decarboxylase family protein YurZ
MKVPSGVPRRYRIVFRGECGDAFTGVFSDVRIESRCGYTCLVAVVRDVSEFYGLLDRFQDLALQPVSINEIGAQSSAALDARSQALIRLAGLAVCGEKPAVLSEQVMTAICHGVSPEEITGALMVLLPEIGAGRLTPVASAVQDALCGAAGERPAAPRG